MKNKIIVGISVFLLLNIGSFASENKNCIDQDNETLFCSNEDLASENLQQKMKDKFNFLEVNNLELHVFDSNFRSSVNKRCILETKRFFSWTANVKDSDSQTFRFTGHAEILPDCSIGQAGGSAN